MMLRRWMVGGAVMCAAALMCSCGSEAEAPTLSARPVTALRLKRVNPEDRVKLTGSVKAWKEQSVGFEVSGRVAWVIDEGTDVDGRIVNENGDMVQEGTVIARIDDTRHKLSVEIAEAQVKSAQAQATATKVELEMILPEKRKAAQADLKSAQNEHERVVQLFKSGTASQAEMDQAETAYQSARAVNAQAEATFDATRAQLEALQAETLQAAESLRSSKKDLSDCTLYAPFDGRVATTDVAPGAYVSPGRGAVKIVVMDPMKIEVPVSGATDRRIAMGDPVMVYPADLETPRMGWVQVKDTIADAATRTFNIGVLARNHRIEIDVPDAASRNLPRIKEVGVIVRENPVGPGPMMVDAEAIQEDEAGHFVWNVQNLDFGGASTPEGRNPVFTVKKVAVKPSDHRRYLLTYEYRALDDAGGLPELAGIVIKVPEGLSDGDKILVIRERWMFRPGDLVPVVLKLPKAGEGFYVPVEALRIEGDKRYVFLAQGQGIGESAARRVEVTMTGAFGELARIEGEGIEEGKLAVMTGAHYLVDGEEISVTSIEEGGDLLETTAVTEEMP